ncbi:MAG: hypothetical protein IKJ39_10540 [Lachnospiraceae bacterium]|nr:hypothetical protein [Lachnospiraceae bacterium]
MAKRKNYKFTNKGHSAKAVLSTFFGALSCISLISLIYLAYLKKGNAPFNYGIAAILALVFAIVGMVLAVLAVQEKEKFLVFGWIGVGLNALAILGVSGILYAGTAL